MRLVDFPRGPDRPFTLAEMATGRKVGLIDDPGMTGEVASWTIGRDGHLESILVRWPDGDVVSYAAQERALVRPEEL